MILLISWYMAYRYFKYEKYIYRIDKKNIIPIVITLLLAGVAMINSDFTYNFILLTGLPWFLLNVAGSWLGTVGSGHDKQYKYNSLYTLSKPFLFIAIYFIIFGEEGLLFPHFNMNKIFEIEFFTYATLLFTGAFVFRGFALYLNSIFITPAALSVYYPIMFLTAITFYRADLETVNALMGLAMPLSILVNYLILYIPTNLLFKYFYNKEKAEIRVSCVDVDDISMLMSYMETSFPSSVLIIWAYFFTFIYFAV